MRAGVWARSVCINENLQKGSVLPFLERCRINNIAVLVMNPNYNSDPKTGIQCPRSRNMNEHAVNVWSDYVVNSGISEIYVVAHSAGGSCLTSI